MCVARCALDSRTQHIKLHRGRLGDEQIQASCVRPRPDAKGCQPVLKKATEAAVSVRGLQSERERDMCERRKSRTKAPRQDSSAAVRAKQQDQVEVMVTGLKLD